MKNFAIFCIGCKELSKVTIHGGGNYLTFHCFECDKKEDLPLFYPDPPKDIEEYNKRVSRQRTGSKVGGSN